MISVYILASCLIQLLQILSWEIDCVLDNESHMRNTGQDKIEKNVVEVDKDEKRWIKESQEVSRKRKCRERKKTSCTVLTWRLIQLWFNQALRGNFKAKRDETGGVGLSEDEEVQDEAVKWRKACGGWHIQKGKKEGGCIQTRKQTNKQKSWYFLRRIEFYILLLSIVSSVIFSDIPWFPFFLLFFHYVMDYVFH